MWRRGAMVFLCGLVVLGCGRQESLKPGGGLKVVNDIVERRAQFVEQSLTADVAHLSAGDRQALSHLVEAARAMDEIFRLQAWAGNPEFVPDVVALDGEGAEAARDYYRIMYGPWDRLLHYEPFLGEQPHPDGAGYYPEDMAAEEFEAWLEAHPADAALIDLAMCHLGGVPLLTTLRKRFPGVRILVLSQSSEQSYVMTLEAFADYLDAKFPDIPCWIGSVGQKVVFGGRWSENDRTA